METKSKKGIKNLGARNDHVVPVGAWVELASGLQSFQNEAIVSAQIEEARAQRLHYEKKERLERFRRDVKKRVKHHHKMKQAYELQASCQAAELQQKVINQTMKSANKLATRKSTCTYRSDDPVAVVSDGESATQSDKEEPDLHHLHQQSEDIGRIVRMAKRNLAQKRLNFQQIEVPGGSWGINYSRDKPLCVSETSTSICPDLPPSSSTGELASYDGGSTVDSLEVRLQQTTEGQTRKTVRFDTGLEGGDSYGAEEELKKRLHPQEGSTLDQMNPLGNYKGTVTQKPVRLIAENRIGDKLNQGRFRTAPSEDRLSRNEYDKSKTKISTIAQDVSDSERGMKGVMFGDPIPNSNEVYDNHKKVPEVRPGVVEEEQKRRTREQYSMYRKLFMDIEREQVKENIRKAQHEKRIERLKRAKEEERQAIERLSEEAIEPRDPFSGQTEEEAVEWEMQEERRVEELIARQRALEKKNTETKRYIKALKAMMRDKIAQQGMEPPPLCACGPTLWDSNPNTCANNCLFYKNPKGYAKALASLLASCDIN